MPVVKQWTVDIHLSEHPEDEAVHTYAEAPERALSDLAGQLLRAAPDDIEAVTHQPTADLVD